MNKLIQTKNRKDSIFKNSSILFSLFLIILFLCLIIFISIKAVEGFELFGIENILFTINFGQAVGDIPAKFSFWLPFTVSILTSLIALIVAVPLGTKTAIFITFRVNKKYRKTFRIAFEVLSGVPSVIFGLFAINSLGVLFKTVFGINTFSVFTASIMLSFMILPTIIAMTINTLESIDRNLLTNPIAMGSTKTAAIYKVYKKEANKGILIAVIVALGRSISESMAVSMILQSGPSDAMFDNGFFELFNSASQTIGAFISQNMFADANPEQTRPLLYSFGLLMLIFAMILNIIVITFSRKKKQNSGKMKIFENRLHSILMFIPNQIVYLFDSIFFRSKFSRKDINECIDYTKDRINNHKIRDFYSYYKIVLEWISIIICFSFLFWIFGDIFVKGFSATNSPSSSMFLYGQNQVGQSFLNTLIIIVVTLFISFPICLFIAIFLNEYSRDGKFKKTILFFIDSLGSTPSILFGMFGLLFFIETLGLTNTGSTGNSIIAGCLTMVIVIIPSFTRILNQSLSNVSKNIRINAYALGSTKFETIRKLILPIAFNGIITSIVLTIGRVLSETAPLYLTAGLSSSKKISLNRPGTSLTTQIYGQIFSNTPDSKNIQYEAAFVTIILVLALIIIGYVIIPNWKNIMNEIKEYYYKILFYVKRNKNV
ncbi:MAG: phosphate ABC transporter permease PstA [Mycoplasmoidaceae bacterium]